MTLRHENRTGPADPGPLCAMSRFRATYDGLALESSEMDVRELAPALLAIGDLLDASTRALCGNQVRPRVNVRGSFKTGSFGIDFTLATSLLGRMRDMLSGNEGTALANAVTILTALGIAAPKAGKGLFAVLKWLRGREILQVQMQDHTAILHVEGDTLEIDLPVLTLLRDVGVRHATEQGSPFARATPNERARVMADAIRLRPASAAGLPFLRTLRRLTMNAHLQRVGTPTDDTAHDHLIR